MGLQYCLSQGLVAGDPHVADAPQDDALGRSFPHYVRQDDAQMRVIPSQRRGISSTWHCGTVYRSKLTAVGPFVAMLLRMTNSR